MGKTQLRLGHLWGLKENSCGLMVGGGYLAFRDDVTDHMAQKYVLTIFRLIVPNNLAMKNDFRTNATWQIMSLW